MKSLVKYCLVAAIILACLAGYSFHRYGNIYFQDGVEITPLTAIADEAVKFVEAENLMAGTKWESMGQNLKVLVSKGLVPLRAKWATPDLGFSDKTVLVVCDKPKIGKPWNVNVPVIDRKDGAAQ